MSIKISMIGAGSIGFSASVAKEMSGSQVLCNAEFMLMDIDEKRLKTSLDNVREIVKGAGSDIKVAATLDRIEALKNCNYVITSCEKQRIKFWKQDILIPEKHGVSQIMGENGGPGGLLHAMRNITLFMEIAADMRRYCPDAWMMNFTNPMSFICTYMLKHTPIRTVGLCHQIHGSFGVVAEMLGMAPGDLQVIAAGINHLAWLIDIRKRGVKRSFMKEFTELVNKSEYWKKNQKALPAQMFTLDVFKAFGIYPVGYDDHIAEYMPFFYERSEWPGRGYESRVDSLGEWEESMRDAAKHSTKEMLELSAHKYPFPKDAGHPYYQEKACTIIEALETNVPTYMDSSVIVNHGAIENLPADAVVDLPSVVAGGQVRSVHVGSLPPAASEICRRQITIHELAVQAAMTGDRYLAGQAMALDPNVRSLKQADDILTDFLELYREELPQFS
jgi:alpha-galactosidase